MSTQPERVSVEQLLQRLRYAEDAYGERLAAETEQLRAENEKLRELVAQVREAAADSSERSSVLLAVIRERIDRAGPDKEQT